jgi:phosphoenolpyruvate carboxylase
MHNPVVEKEFEKAVKNKFNVYNSLFLNLPFRKVHNIGIFIPLLHQMCKTGLDSGHDPLHILDSFFNTQAIIKSEEEKIDFMFRVIQYVERQVVLYDSVEDAAFSHLQKFSDDLSLKDFINLLENKDSKPAIVEILSTFSARIVLTAHPTQFYPPSVLNIISRLRNLINENKINDIDLSLQQLGLTSLTNTKAPTPFEEARNIIYFLNDVYYDAVGDLYTYIRKTLPNNSFDNPAIIQLGFWPGGDRDGNPFVTAETTAQVADELRMTLMKCYYRDIKNLQLKISFRGVEEIIEKLRTAIYPAMYERNKTLKYNDIFNPLIRIREILLEKYNGLYLEELDNIIDKVKIFRTHFAVLDIRQNHLIHKSVVEEILLKQKLIRQNLDELPKNELIRILFQTKVKLSPQMLTDPVYRDTIQTITLLKNIQRKNGSEGCCRYIISNSEDIYSVLFVYALFRWCNAKETVNFDIIPLFESMEGMTHAPAIMRELFGLPEYKTHLKKRGNIQTIMLGFSDGTKDGGYLQANWSIFRTKELLSAVCVEFGIKAIFFDGRGGPPARGGGKMHRFYASQSENIANHAIQVTIQGQTITSKYGTKEHFIHNCEQLLTAGLSNRFFKEKNSIPDEQRELIEELARLSFEKYNALKNHPMFVPYLENKSTLRYYSQANIGSRPAKRGRQEKLEFKDLRAIPFVGSWSQLKQNVPGYYGIGTALHTMKQQGKLQQLRTLFREIPFFKALIQNSMMSLSKCYFELTRYIAKDAKYTGFWNMLYEEYKLSKEMVLTISDYTKLMEEEPVSRNSIKIRERIVLPLLVIQQYALQKIENNTSNKKIYEKMVKRSLYGNINASRNSA